MRLIICRHGETVENANNILQGYNIEGGLSSKGKKQALLLAKRLEKESIGAIYSSDLERAADTAKKIAELHPNVPLVFTKELRERKCGPFSGKTAPSDWRTNFKKYENVKGVENNQQLYERARKFFNKILHSQKETILVVGHNAIDRALICVITGRKPEEINSMDRLGNTSISVFSIEKSACKTVSYNDSKHLYNSCSSMTSTENLKKSFENEKT